MDHSPQHRFDGPHEDNAVIDQGTFIWECDGAPLAYENFTMLRSLTGGFLKKKRTGLKLLTIVSSPDGSLDLETMWDYDERLCPTGIDVLNRAKAFESGKKKRAVFSFRDSNAQLQMGPKDNLTVLNIGYEKGWLVAVEPSVMLFAVMLGRYDMESQGVQDFTVLRTSAMDDFFSLTKNRLSLVHKCTFNASAPKGVQTEIHYFIGRERTIKRGREKTPPHRCVHLWSDGEQRLRKVLITSGAQKVIAYREGDEDLSPLLSPRRDS